jgi:hypothetical protein
VIRVDIVEADCPVTKANLALAGLANLDGLPGEDIRAAWFLETNRVGHELPLDFSERRRR